MDQPLMPAVVVDSPLAQAPKRSKLRAFFGRSRSVANSNDRQQTTQGWLQTTIILLTFLIGGTLAFAKLDALAQEALKTANRAELKADDVDKRSHESSQELVRIRTILDERLPKKGSAAKDD